MNTFIKSFFIFLLIMSGVLLGSEELLATAKMTGSNSYILKADFLLGRDIPLSIDFDKAVVSGEFTGTYPTTDPDNIDTTEELIESSTIEGTYQNGEIVFTIYKTGIGRKNAPCGVWEIRSQNEFTLTATVGTDLSLTPTGTVQSRRRLDPFMKTIAQKKTVEGQDLPPYYDVPCGGQSSGFFFRDSDLAWKSETLTGSSGAWSAISTKPALAPIKIVRVGEDATYRKPGSQEDVLLTDSIKLEVGDMVYAMSQPIDISIGEHSLTVYPYTSFRLDEASLASDRITKTRVYLLDGAIKSRIPHADASRGDFHVATPGANASIRGSEMIVVYNIDTKESTIFVTEDQAFVQVKEDSGASGVTVTEGNKVSVASEVVSQPTSFSETELPAGALAKGVSLSWVWVVSGGILIVLVGGVFYAFKRRR